MSELEKDKLTEIINQRIVLAEKAMLENFYKDLYSGDVTPLTPEQIEAYKKAQRIQKLLAPYYWLKIRIVGTWNIWKSGNCGACDYND